MLQMLPQRPQLYKFALSATQVLLALQKLILLEGKLLAQYLLLIAQNIKVLFEADHVLVEVIVFLIRFKLNLALSLHVRGQLGPLLHQQINVVLFAVQSGLESLVSS